VDYGYDAQNRRIWSWPGAVDGVGNTTNYTVNVYSPSGQKLGAYLFTPSSTGYEGEIIPIMVVTLSSSDQYFGGRRLAPMDQLGSVVNSSQSYFPWGETKGTSNPQDTWNFATYWQDSWTGLDYANNRYYSNAYGRFMTPDPYTNSGRLTDPQSWNRYAYTRGDPVNRADPGGLQDCDPNTCVTVTGSYDNLDYMTFSLNSGWGGNGYITSSMVAGAVAAAASAAQQYRLWLPKQVLGNGTGAQIGALDAGYWQALQTLLSNPDCSSYIDGNQAPGYPDPSKVGLSVSTLENTTYWFEPLPNNSNGTPSTGTAAAVVNNSTVFINTVPGSVFFNQTGYVIPGNLTGAAADAFFLLHELAHQTGVFGVDTGNQDLENQENQSIFDHCFKQQVAN
jgi:RHS repeat-associated protein